MNISLFIPLDWSQVNWLDAVQVETHVYGLAWGCCLFMLLYNSLGDHFLGRGFWLCWISRRLLFNVGLLNSLVCLDHLFVEGVFGLVQLCATLTRIVTLKLLFSVLLPFLKQRVSLGFKTRHAVLNGLGFVRVSNRFFGSSRDFHGFICRNFWLGFFEVFGIFEFCFEGFSFKFEDFLEAFACVRVFGCSEMSSRVVVVKGGHVFHRGFNLLHHYLLLLFGFSRVKRNPILVLLSFG